jgi:hypothetical protein
MTLIAVFCQNRTNPGFKELQLLRGELVLGQGKTGEQSEVDSQNASADHHTLYITAGGGKLRSALLNDFRFYFA